MICFYLGDAVAAMLHVPELSALCPRLPPWATCGEALGPHGCHEVHRGPWALLVRPDLGIAGPR